MEKKPEVDGSWLEVSGDQVVEKLEELEKASIIVVNESRIEMGLEDKQRFVQKFKETMSEQEGALNGMDDSQKSYFIIRKMLLS